MAPEVDKPGEPAYPAHWESDVVLADGGTMRVRPIRVADGALIEAFHARQSSESIYLRYFSPRPRLSERDLARLTTVDYVDRMAFVGLVGDELVGVARYDRLPTLSVAEVAFFTDDEHQRRGVATVLLEYLAAAARELGLAGFVAQVLPHNHRMLSVFKQAGFQVASRFGDGVIEVELGIEPTPEALEAIEARARHAYARSVRRILAPRSVAVVGASREPGGVGHEVLRRIIAGGFQGPVYPVNPEATYVASVRAFATVGDVPDEIDLAVVCVPAEQTLAVVEACACKRVQGLVIVSAGFAERDERGATLQRAVVEVARRHGMRIVGPNSMGVINTAPDVSLEAIFVGQSPLPGRVGLSSQSGTLGAAIINHARRLGLGISTFVAVGNKPDVSGNDLLQYWEEDDATDVVLLYLESFGNLRNFARIARRLSRRKPIVAVKSGLALHQGDADAGSWPAEATIDALLGQTGVLRVDTMEQLFEVGRVLAQQPVPGGNRVAVLSNSWGPAVLAADACLAAGLQLATFDPGTVEAVAEVVPAYAMSSAARTANPLDVGHEAGADEYRRVLSALLADDGIDAVLVLFAPPMLSETQAVGEAIASAAANSGRAVVATFLGAGANALAHGETRVPVFEFPEAAAWALGLAARYGEWRAADVGSFLEAAPVAVEAVRAIVERFLSTHPDGDWLDLREAEAILVAAEVRTIEQELVTDVDEAVTAARRLGPPVALKATGMERLAKTEAGGVAIDVYGDDEVRQSYERMAAALGDAMHPARVQAMASPGVDVRIEVHQNPALGSVVSLGVGGAAAEAYGEPITRVLPLNDVDASQLVKASRLEPLLEDLGDGAAAALTALLLQLAAMADAVPELGTVVLNPIIVTSDSACVTDFSVRVARWTGDPTPQVRRLE